jgi:D-alanyl-lipoteichoic acid acyltransferase DltB (MBOAT superfamily)
MLTMVLGGLWHGAAWTFVVWGIYQGVVLAVGRGIAEAGRPLTATWQRVALALVMFQVTCYGWLIFRAQSVEQIVDFTRRLFVGPAWGATTGSHLSSLLLIVTPLLLVHAYQARHDDELAVANLPRPLRYAIYGGVAYLVLLFGDFEGAEFIYFQF